MSSAARHVSVPSRNAVGRVISVAFVAFGCLIGMAAGWDAGLDLRSVGGIVVGGMFVALGAAGLLLRPDGVTVRDDSVEIRDALRSTTVPRQLVADVEIRRLDGRSSVFVVLRTGDAIELRHTRVKSGVQVETMSGGTSTVLIERFVQELRGALRVE